MNALERTARIGDVFLDMDSGEDFPLPNIRRVARTAMEYYHKQLEGSDEEIDKHISEEYIITHIRAIKARLAKRRKPFGYVRNYMMYTDEQLLVTGESRLAGLWKFLNKEEQVQVARHENNDIATRVDGFNERLDGYAERWPSLRQEVAPIADVPRIEADA